MSNMRALREILKVQKPDEAKIKPLLAKLEGNHGAMQGIRTEELKGLKEILTIEQQARFLVFQQEFQHNMRRMIAGARGVPGKGDTKQEHKAPRGDPGSVPTTK